MFHINVATRREFMTRGLGLVGVGSVLPNYLIRTALGAPEARANDRILVVLQLNGGNDALSTLVPYGHEEYGKVRNATRIGDDKVIKLNNELGLHPNLTGFKELLDQGAFAAIPGVGYPNPNYSHFKATDIWHMADRRGRQIPHGWIGRACDHGFEGNKDPKLTLAVGTGKAPLVIKGREHPGLAFNQPESFRYVGDRGKKDRAALYRKLNETGLNQATGNLRFVAETAVSANASSDQIRRLARTHKPKVEYPNTRLGKNLRVIAGLIVGRLGTRFYVTFQGGYDTHSGQRKNHDNLMAQLGGAVLAFQNDLAQNGHADRVLLCTTSEFGRRVKENGSQGTDHGAAAASFLFGPGLKPGIHGKHPSLTDLQGGGGGSLKHTTDFRSLYATMLEKWLGIPSEPVLGKKYPLVDCVG